VLKKGVPFLGKTATRDSPNMGGFFGLKEEPAGGKKMSAWVLGQGGVAARGGIHLEK